MERFFNNNDESNEDDETPFFKPYGDDEMDGEAVAYLSKDHILDVMQMDLAQTELNQALVAQAVAIAEKNILWYITPYSKKLAEIEAIYKKLAELTDGDVEGKDNEDADL